MILIACEQLLLVAADVADRFRWQIRIVINNEIHELIETRGSRAWSPKNTNLFDLIKLQICISYLHYTELLSHRSWWAQKVSIS